MGLVFGQQVRDVRKRRGWDRDRLAAEVNRTAGTSWPGTTVTKIERGTRRVDLDELLTLSLVLGVAPVHLLAPRDDAAAVAVGGMDDVPAPRLRAFIRGAYPLSPDAVALRSAGDVEAARAAEAAARRWFFAEVPDAEFGGRPAPADLAYAEADRLRAAGDVEGAEAAERDADALFEHEQDATFERLRAKRADPDRLSGARRLLAESLRLAESLSPEDLQRLADNDDEGDAR